MHTDFAQTDGSISLYCEKYHSTVVLFQEP